MGGGVFLYIFIVLVSLQVLLKAIFFSFSSFKPFFDDDESFVNWPIPI